MGENGHANILSVVSSSKVANLSICIVLALIAAAAEVVSGILFVIGLQQTETNPLILRTLVGAGAVMIVGQMCCFFVSQLMKQRGWKHGLWVFGLCLIAFEGVNITLTQFVIAKNSHVIGSADREYLESAQAGLDASRRLTETARVNALRSGQSKILASRSEAKELLTSAIDRENKNLAVQETIRNEKKTLRTTLLDLISEKYAVIYFSIRSFLIVLTGIVMFALSGRFFSDYFSLRQKEIQDNSPDPKNKKPLPKEDDVKTPVFPPANAPSFTSVASPLMASYAVPVGTLVSGARSDIVASGCSDIGASDVAISMHPVPSNVTFLKGLKKKSAHRKRTPGVADTCVNEGKNHRFKRVLSAVKRMHAAGEKPAVRGVIALCAGWGMGCSQNTARRWLDEMVSMGLLVKVQTKRGVEYDFAEGFEGVYKRAV